MNDHGILSRSSTTQDILMRLRMDIILRKYPAGTPVREVLLADSYGVSRTAVRNALIVLEKEGLIQVRPNGTKNVVCLEQDDIKNLYNLREYIEQTAVGQFFIQKDKNLAPLLTVMQQISDARDLSIDDILQIDTRFHRAVIEASRNKALLQVWETIADVMQAIFHLNMTDSEEYSVWYRDTFCQRHVDLFSAMMVSSEKSLEVFTRHIEDALEVSQRAVAKAGLPK